MYCRFFSFYATKEFIDKVGGKLVRGTHMQQKRTSQNIRRLYLNFKHEDS